MVIDWSLYGTIISPVVAVIIGVIFQKKITEKPKLISYISHTSAIYTKAPNGSKMNVHTHSIAIQNAGNKPANNIKIGHNILPAFSIHPSTSYEINELPDGKKEIVIPVLIPKERIIINYLYFPPILWTTINTYTKSDEGYAKIVKMQLQQKSPKWATLIVGMFTLLGLVSFLYFIVILVRTIF